MRIHSFVSSDAPAKTTELWMKCARWRQCRTATKTQTKNRMAPCRCDSVYKFKKSTDDGHSTEVVSCANQAVVGAQRRAHSYWGGRQSRSDVRRNSSYELRQQCTIDVKTLADLLDWLYGSSKNSGKHSIINMVAIQYKKEMPIDLLVPERQVEYI